MTDIAIHTGCACCADLLRTRFDRRRFLHIAAGAGLAAALPSFAFAAEGNYDAMLLTCIDPREQWLARLPSSPRLTKVQTETPPAEVAKLPPDAFVLCMTMGHRTDRPILEEIFRHGRTFPYLGVIGSKAKRAVLRRELLAAGISADQVDAFECPIGLPLGSNSPGEIAISVAAQLLERRDAWRNQLATMPS